MGTELGHPALPLVKNARAEFRLVAATCPRCAALFPFVSDRPRSRLLSHLRVSVATAAEQKISRSRVGPNARENGWPRAAFQSTRRCNAGELFRQLQRGRTIPSGGLELNREMPSAGLSRV